MGTKYITAVRYNESETHIDYVLVHSSLTNRNPISESRQTVVNAIRSGLSSYFTAIRMAGVPVR